MRHEPVHRTILALDVEGSTRGTNATRRKIRERMYRILADALRGNPVLLDRGDGVIALFREVPKTLLLTTVVPRIAELLAREQFRLRVAMHAGEVGKDDRGYFGEAIDLTCRLLDAQSTKRALRTSAAALVLVVSDEIYRSVVCQGYDGIDATAFEPVVKVRLGGRVYRGWVQPADRSAPMRGKGAVEKTTSTATSKYSAIFSAR